MTPTEFTRRLRRYESGQQWALVVGALPLLAVYLAVHTRWLKPSLQDHKHLMVLLMIVLPLGWLFGVAQGWKRLGSRWIGLRCASCGGSLAALTPPQDGGTAPCAACGAPAIESDPAAR
jgi:hypothetical protein